MEKGFKILEKRNTARETEIIIDQPEIYARRNNPRKTDPIYENISARTQKKK